MYFTSIEQVQTWQYKNRDNIAGDFSILYNPYGVTYRADVKREYSYATIQIVGGVK